MKNQKGFSLIELLIVVVIIGIIAAIAIPNLLASRRASNEASAISSLRTLHGAQMTYQATTGAGNYAGSVGGFGPSVDGSVGITTLRDVGLIDSVLGSQVKSGYGFRGYKQDATNGTPAQFWWHASPRSITGVTQTGTREFGIATEGVIYFNSNLSGGNLFNTVNFAADGGTALSD